MERGLEVLQLQMTRHITFWIFQTIFEMLGVEVKSSRKVEIN